MKEILTPREFEIVSELSKGYSEAYVAEKLRITYATVNHAINRALYKLRIPTKRGIINPGGALVALYRKEHPRQPLWFDEMELPDNRTRPRNCSDRRGPEHVKFA